MKPDIHLWKPELRLQMSDGSILGANYHPTLSEWDRKPLPVSMVNYRPLFFNFLLHNGSNIAKCFKVRDVERYAIDCVPGGITQLAEGATAEDKALDAVHKMYQGRFAY